MSSPTGGRGANRPPADSASDLPFTSSVLRNLIATNSRLSFERDQLQQLVEHVPAVLYIDEMPAPGSHHYVTVYVGPQVEEILGITREEWIRNDDLWREVMHPDDWERASTQFEEYRERGGILVQEYRLVRPDTGHVIWIRDECAITQDPKTGADVVIGVMLDISNQKRLEEQLRNAEAKHRALIDQLPNVVWVEPISPEAGEPFVSRSVRELFGVEREAWLAANWWSRHLHPEDRSRVLRARKEIESSREPLRLEYRMVTPAAGELWIGQVAHVVLDDDGRPWVVQSLLENITARKQAEEALEFQATHDPLTGLANRSLFEASLESALARARRRQGSAALLFLDLDGFKAVNDAHGHEAGDDFLREVARRLRRSVRESDLVGRRSGDEFLVLLPDIDPAPGETTDSRHRADRVADATARRIRRSFAEPIRLGETAVTPGISIGSCVFPYEAGDAASMLAAADAAMYRAKTTRPDPDES